MSELITIYVDGQAHQVQSDKNLLQACLDLGLELGYFCWHPSLGSVGSCRQCAVTMFQNAQDTRGRLIMACMTPVAPDMIVSISDQNAHTFRATNIEALMTNHPHDCPVCEEGGDCHLQDMTLMSEHVTRRYDGDKRTHHNQYLGPLINHEMNRCIGCYRCVRFYRDYCDDDDLNVFGSKNQVYFGRASSGTLHSHFSGNLAEVCPTGVFTDKTFSGHYARKWDLQSSPTICQHCSLGCNTYTGSYKQKVRKITNRHQPQINGHFICDRGRYAYQHANSQQRTIEPLLRNKQNARTEAIAAPEAKRLFKQWVAKCDGNVVALGSARTSIENNLATQQLLEKFSIGQNFYCDASDHCLALMQHQIKFYQHQQITPCTLEQIEQADCAIIIGEDVINTAPRLALSLRQMVRNKGKELAAKIGIAPWQDQALRNVTQQHKSPLFVLGATPSKLSDIAKWHQPLSLEQQHQVLTHVRDYLRDQKNDPPLPTDDCAAQIIKHLLLAERPLLVWGDNHSNLSIQTLIQQIIQCLAVKQQPMVHYVSSAANTQALAIMTPAKHGLDSFLRKITEQPPRLLVIVEADLDWLLASTAAQAIYDDVFEKIEHVVVLDHLTTKTAQMADLILPCANGFEQQGCWLNSQGTIQLSQANLSPAPSVLPSWQWCETTNSGLAKHHYAQLLMWGAASHPLFNQLSEFIATEKSHFRLARQPFRASGRTAINADIDVKEYPPASDDLSVFQFSMEGVPPFRQHNTDIKTASGAYIWQPKWNSGQGINKSQQSSGQPWENDDKSAPNTSIFSDSQKLASSEDDQSVNDVAPLMSIAKDEFIVLSQPDIYAHDELSHYSQALTQLATERTITLNQQTADLLHWTPGQYCTLTHHACTLTLHCIINSQCSDNTIILDNNSYIECHFVGLQPRINQVQLSLHTLQEQQQ